MAGLQSPKRHRYCGVENGHVWPPASASIGERLPPIDRPPRGGKGCFRGLAAIPRFGFRASRRVKGTVVAFEIWLAYVATTLGLMSTPGPSQLLMLSTSLQHGFRPSMATAAGDLTANFLQMLTAGLGLAAVVVASKEAFAIVKWLGAAYLVYLGVTMIRRSFGPAETTSRQTPASVHRLWWRGFVTSAANPKAVVFFAALFPLFIVPNQPFWPQFFVLSATYLFIDGTFLAAYGLLASQLGRYLRGGARVWLERVGGGCVILAGALLSLRTLREHG